MPINRARPLSEIRHADGKYVAWYLEDPSTFMGEDGKPVSEEYAVSLGVDLKRIGIQRKRAELLKAQERERLALEARLEREAEEALRDAEETASNVQSVDPESIADLAPLKWSKHNPARLRGTKDLEMVHSAGDFWFVHKRSDEDGDLEEEPLSERITGDEAVRFMLNWHASQSEEESD